MRRGRFESFQTAVVSALALALLALSSAGSVAQSKTDFDIIEGIFHDGLGTYAEVMLANELISLSRIKQPPFDASRSKAKLDCNR